MNNYFVLKNKKYFKKVDIESKIVKLLIKHLINND